MKIIKKNNWIYIYNKNHKTTQIKGKYLFFSDSKQELISLAKNILSKLGLIAAKISSKSNSHTSKGFAFVLCVYDLRNRYSDFLKTLETETISYRYWKSDEATKKGIYSKQYLNSN